MAKVTTTTRRMTLEEYAAKERELQELPAGSRVTDAQGLTWAKDWGDMWGSTEVFRMNSTALVARLNEVEVAVGGGSPLF